jgi:hypothetical protein
MGVQGAAGKDKSTRRIYNYPCKGAQFHPFPLSSCPPPEVMKRRWNQERKTREKAENP